MKRLITLLLVLNLSLCAVGCGPSDEAPAEPPPGSGEDAVEDVPASNPY